LSKITTLAVLLQRRHHAHAGGLGKRAQLAQRVGGVAVVVGQVHPNQHGEFCADIDFAMTALLHSHDSREMSHLSSRA
jgi:hypothetical protein